MNAIRIASGNPLASALTLVVVVLGVWLGWTRFELYRANNAVIERTVERDRLALDAATERARADGWKTTLADSTRSLHRILAERDSMAARLAADLRASRVRLAYLAEVNVTLRSQVESWGEEVPTEAGPDVRAWRGELSDSLLWAEWAFGLPDARLVLDPYTVTISGELVGGEGGDGRHVVFVRPFDPRVSMNVGRYTVELPEPVTVDHCSWTRRGMSFLAGLAGGVVLKW